MNRSLPLVLSLLSLNIAVAQETVSADEHSADRSALRELGSRYEQAINSGDLRSLAPIVAPSASAVFATNHEVQGLDGMQKYFDSIKERLGKGSSYTVKLDPDRTEFSGDIAVAHGRSDETAKLGNGTEYRFTTHWTTVLRKEEGTWKAFRLHVSMDPFDNAVINARLKQRTFLVAGLGLVVAAAAFMAGRFGKKPGKNS